MLCKSALITGCNRGLGLEFVKQLVEKKLVDKLFATCRNPSSAQELSNLAKEHSQIIQVLTLDMTDESGYEDVVNQVSNSVGVNGLNLLINNAGYSPRATKINLVTWQQMVDTLTINTIAPLMFTKACLPLLKKAATTSSQSSMSVKKAAVVNISSILGSIEANNSGGLYPYKASKTGLNSITKSLSMDLKDDNILAVSVHPGWVQTDMGGHNAPLTAQKSITDLLNMFQKLDDTSHGSFIQYDGKPLPW